MSDPKSERKFLHDISSPLGTALFISDVLAESLTVGSPLSEEDLQQIKTILSELDRVKNMIQKRREILIQEESQKPQ